MGIFGGLFGFAGGGGQEDDEEDMDDMDDGDDGFDGEGEDDDAEDLDGGGEGKGDDKGDGQGKGGDNPEDLDKDPAQDGPGSKQDGPDGGEKDPSQDGPGSKQDGPDKEEKKKEQDDKKKGDDKKGGKGGGAPGKLKDPWDPLVTMEIAKACGIPPIPVPYPCPECKKMTLYLDTWVKNGGRLTILMAYTIIMLIATKSCPVNVKDFVQQVHFLCLNSKCKKFHFNSFKYKFVPNMTSGVKLDTRQWLFASPFPKMTAKEAEKIRKKVSGKDK